MGAKGMKALSPALRCLTQLRELYLGGEYSMTMFVKTGFGSACRYIFLLVGWCVNK